MMNSDQNSFAISAGHKDTLEAAQLILEEGGTAIDAAVSAFLVSMVAEPCMSSPGGGGMALIKDIDHTIYSCDFFCQTPQRKISKSNESFYPITVDFGEATEEFYIGAGSIAVPGSIAGIYKLHKHFGKIPLRELFLPAVGLAKEGSVIDKFQAYNIQMLESILNQSTHSIPLFYKEDKLKQEGDLLRFEKMADFFEVLSIEGNRFFYEGDIAIAIDKICKENGGHLTTSDLINYQANLGPAFQFPIRNMVVSTAGFPSKGGPLIACLLDAINIKNIASPFGKTHLNELKDALLTSIEFKQHKEKLKKYLWQRFRIRLGEGGGLKSGGTTHFSIQDKDGMAISLTTSLGEGSGVWVENADIQLNNMLGEEALMEKGFYNWTPDSRLMSMMSPTIVQYKDDWLITGSGGAGRIPFVIGQLIHYIFDLGYELDSATNMPRIFYRNGMFEIESGFENSNNENENHWPSKSLFFGGSNSIFCKDTIKVAVADQRRFGCAIFK